MVGLGINISWRGMAIWALDSGQGRLLGDRQAKRGYGAEGLAGWNIRTGENPHLPYHITENHHGGQH